MQELGEYASLHKGIVYDFGQRAWSGCGDAAFTVRRQHARIQNVPICRVNAVWLSVTEAHMIPL